jgi:hypothetical protein
MFLLLDSYPINYLKHLNRGSHTDFDESETMHVVAQ